MAGLRVHLVDNCCNRFVPTLGCRPVVAFQLTPAMLECLYELRRKFQSFNGSAVEDVNGSLFQRCKIQAIGQLCDANQKGFV